MMYVRFMIERPDRPQESLITNWSIEIVPETKPLLIPSATLLITGLAGCGKNGIRGDFPLAN